MQTTSKRAPDYRPSFTLVELLVAIAIIGVMTGMVLFSLAGAQRDAMTARTRSTIGKLNDVILQEWEKFRYRSVRVDVPSEWLRPSTINGQPPLSPREASRLRMIVLRDTMRMELPDRMSDILYPPTLYVTAGNTANNSLSPPVTSDDVPYTVTSRHVPGKFNTYRQKFGLSAIPSPYTGAVGVVGSANNGVHESAELLYQIVAAASYQSGSALELFRPTEIGDIDGDFLPEFLDAWGTPIAWIRWPAGFDSPLNDTSARDPMDPLRVDWRHSKYTAYMPPNFTPKPWLMIPLVISAGPDGVFDLENSSSISYAAHIWQHPTDSSAHFSDPSISRNVYYFPDPYVNVYDKTGKYWAIPPVSAPRPVGATLGAGADDNISNYQLILE